MEIEEFIAQWHDANDCVPVYTSGSTGKPKLMMAEKARMEASARMTCKALGLKSGDKALVCLPMDYVAGKMMVVRSLVCGLDMICVPPSGNPLQTVDCGIDFAAMVPMQVYNSLSDADQCRKIKNIKHILIGGGAVDKDMEAVLRTFPNAVWSSYGMTETLSHIALRRIDGNGYSQWYEPLPGVGISLAGNGCLVIDAPLVCPQTLHTHDIAVIDESAGRKRFRILGRLDNVICSGGVKIQIEDVEMVLASHLSKPFIVTKRPSKKFGEEVVLLTEDMDTDGVAATCRSVLPHYWQPKAILHVGAVPTTATGKPARAEAARLALRSQNL